MSGRFHSTSIVATIVSCFAFALLQSETYAVESYKKQEQELSKKRFKQEKWAGSQQSDMAGETIQFKHWNKNYSSLGSKKWDYSVEKTRDKKRFEAGTVDFLKKNKEIEFSDWQSYLADLETKAQVSTDTTARITQDKRIYEVMLQQAENYKDTGKQLSLRDINRFQFRKNRPEDDVPTTKVGSGEIAQ